MALIKIKTDAFNICERIKKIDKNYFVVYNTTKNQYEIHNTMQKSNTFCVVCDKGLNCQVIDKLRKTKIENMQKVISEIEKNNEYLEKEQKRKLMDNATWKAREMFNYAKGKIDNCDFKNSYSTKWV